ncbi:uncharacterized protein LTR77_010881 [Saxophila tyrrhenica]|uniref:Uncharacterized protein n=1 Tax=Saxophila tyrrhenica TaxID=1690608 RepID=A0AAV9NWL9_9PEZI|nr:hypothetical protein LTR77_010881 [Saxophila tyrrhenica]
MEGASSDQRPQYTIIPGQSLADLRTLPLRRTLTCILDLGASLHEILHLIKAKKDQYKQINLHYEPKNPLEGVVVVNLPDNGFRLRFDGKDQRLRLIEVTDFSKLVLIYKGSVLAKGVTENPAFRRVYQLFGASYPGEYIPPQNAQGVGQYVLSWAGIAFVFPVQHSAWAPEKNHVNLLDSSAASPAAAMSLFEGSSWPEVRQNIFTKPVSGPRLSGIAARPKDNLPAEIEIANIHQHGRIELQRRAPAAPFTTVLNETTSQDLITELGPPDATHKKIPDVTPSDRPSHLRASSMSNGRPRPGSQPSSYSSTGTDTFDADFDSGDADDDASDRSVREVFWCYFSHGMDILVGPRTTDGSSAAANPSLKTSSPHLVVLKVIIHGNVPGSYAFNRHRRLRWTLEFPEHSYLGPLNSETPFESSEAGGNEATADGLRDALLHIFQSAGVTGEMGRGKVVNRTWGGAGDGGDLSDTGFFLPDAEKELVEGNESESWLGNTQLFAFPGLGFEVGEGGWVGAVSVC